MPPSYQNPSTSLKSIKSLRFLPATEEFLPLLALALAIGVFEAVFWRGWVLVTLAVIKFTPPFEKEILKEWRIIFR